MSYCKDFKTDGTCSKIKDDCIHLGDEIDECEIKTKGYCELIRNEAEKLKEVRHDSKNTMHSSSRRY